MILSSTNKPETMADEALDSATASYTASMKLLQDKIADRIYLNKWKQKSLLNLITTSHLIKVDPEKYVKSHWRKLQSTSKPLEYVKYYWLKLKNLSPTSDLPRPIGPPIVENIKCMVLKM